MQQLQGATSTSVTAEAQPACHHADRRLPILHETQFIRAQLLSHTSSRKPIAAPTASNMLAASAAPPCAATAPHQHQQEHPLQLPIPALDNQVPWGLPNAATASNRCRCNPSRGCTCAPAAAAGSAAQLVLLQPAVVLRQQQARPHGKALLRARRRRLAQRDGQHAAAALALCSHGSTAAMSRGTSETFSKIDLCWYAPITATAGCMHVCHRHLFS